MTDMWSVKLASAYKLHVLGKIPYLISKYCVYSCCKSFPTG